MRDLNPERRLQRAFERLGTDDPRCALCGETDPRCLERHHLAGQAYADETVIHCRNCHRKLSDGQKDHPIKIGAPPDLCERVGHFLLGLADLFAQIVEILRRRGRELIETVRRDAFDGGSPS